MKRYGPGLVFVLAMFAVLCGRREGTQEEPPSPPAPPAIAEREPRVRPSMVEPPATSPVAEARGGEAEVEASAVSPSPAPAESVVFEGVVQHVDALSTTLSEDAWEAARERAREILSAARDAEAELQASASEFERRSSRAVERFESARRQRLGEPEPEAAPIAVAVRDAERVVAIDAAPPASQEEETPPPVAPVDPRPAIGLSPEERRALVDEGARAFGRAIDAASRRYGLDPGFLLCVIGIESRFDPAAVSRAGAQGLMQLMPRTAGELGVNPFDLRENVLGGAGYIDRMLRAFGESVRLGMAAYNAGPGAVRRYGGIPPFEETRRYVSRIENECGPARRGRSERTGPEGGPQ